MSTSRKDTCDPDDCGNMLEMKASNTDRLDKDRDSPFLSKMVLSRPEFRLFSGYVICAGIATMVDVGLLFSLTEFIHFHYFYSAAAAYIAGMTTNYLLNKVFNFKNKNKHVVYQFGLFAIVAFIGLGFNQLIIYFLVEFASMWYMLAKLISIAVVMLWSFYGHKKLTFGVLR